MNLKKGTDSKGSGKATRARNHIQKLCHVATPLKEETAAARYAQQQEKSLELLRQPDTNIEELIPWLFAKR